MTPFKGTLAVVAALGFCLSVHAADSAGRMTEEWSHVPMPPGFQVVGTELEGPVFADAQGRTLYKWPIASLRNGYAGDPKDKSVCEDKITTKTGGFMSPWPGGLDLPELDKRKSCLAEWPAVIAGDDAKPIGKWTIITRNDGRKQWAYDNHALYISSLDQKPGDTYGGTTAYKGGGDTPAERMPVSPPSAVPPGFIVDTTVRGRMLLTDKRKSVYISDRDGPNKSNCHDACTNVWKPLIAPASARADGEWSIVEQAPGVNQWAYRKHPLYTYERDQGSASLEGGDVPGWHNVYTQLAPKAPDSAFTVQETIAGDVLADKNGKTVYFYTCGDDSSDQLSCDTMASPQVYRLAICGGLNKERCAKLWHYVAAEPNAESDSRLWTVVNVDPATGHEAPPGQGLAVWAYRDRPVYTYADDKKPGDYWGNALGEWQGRRNGFRAFWIRDELFGRG